jgi:benzoylformate decarboxylase
VALADHALTGLVPTSQRPPVPVARRPGAAAPVPVDRLMAVLDRVLPDGAVVVNEAFSSEGKRRQYVPVRQPGSFYGSAGGGLGFGLPGPSGSSSRCPGVPW